MANFTEKQIQGMLAEIRDMFGFGLQPTGKHREDA